MHDVVVELEGEVQPVEANPGASLERELVTDVRV